MSLEKAVNQMYKEKEKLIILGLTGRTGSGCSKVAEILQKEEIRDLDLRQCKEYDYTNVEERKNRIIYEYMCVNDRWKGFTVIEVSSIILACALSLGQDAFESYIKKITEQDKETTINFGEKRKVLESLSQIDYMFQECMKMSLDKFKDEDFNSEDRINRYYVFYTITVKEYKRRFKEIMDNFSCYEIHSDKLKGKQQSNYHLYTFLLQQMGNNIRCSGNPFDDTFSEEKYCCFVKKLKKIINIIYQYEKQYAQKEEKPVVCRICIDAIRNPYEALYLKDRYRSFHLISVNTDDVARKKRLKDLNTEELINLDKIEYAQKMERPEELFYHQNIQGCIQYADIHVYNPDIMNGKYYELTEQLLKYVSLMLRPGLVTPTHMERCMQLAYNAKFNSGCLSRQVGAVVTREDFSVQSIGWNDVPKGQVSCNLRDIDTFCRNKDEESYSKYEIEDTEFEVALCKVNRQTKGKTSGRCMNYCFKDVYNGMKNKDNQVYTRALHAEENAFLQISKYGGMEVQGGCLFTTASPCELCAKKAYQLGIKYIYYIDPYPGISQRHILTFGKQGNPEMKLFYGAIGQAYMDFYEPRIPIKDELELLTGKSVKAIVKEKDEASNINYEDIRYENMVIEMVFDGGRSKIETTREISATLLKDGIDHLEKKIIWTGSSYDGTKLSDEENVNDSDISIKETSNKMPYRYSIIFEKPKAKGDKIHYKIKTSAKDEKNVMEPYHAHMVKHATDDLTLRLVVPKELIHCVKRVIYADFDMKIKVYEEDAEKMISPDREELEVYEFNRKDVNVNYTYAIEWKFLEE